MQKLYIADRVEKGKMHNMSCKEESIQPKHYLLFPLNCYGNLNTVFLLQFTHCSNGRKKNES